MTNGQPPRPPVPQGMLIGQPPQGAPAAAMNINMVSRADIRRTLYQAASALAQAKGQILAVASLLSELGENAKKTDEAIQSGNLMVRDQGMHIGPKAFAEKYGMATGDDVQTLTVLLNDLRAASASVPLEEFEDAAKEEAP